MLPASPLLRCPPLTTHARAPQNQFFISGCDDDPDISNRVAGAILSRVRRAVAEDAPFHVIIVLPLLPSFEGKVDSPDGSTLRAVMHWQFRALCRGGSSLLERLAKEVPEPWRYVSVFGLRQHDVQPTGRPVTEQVGHVACRRREPSAAASLPPRCRLAATPSPLDAHTPYSPHHPRVAPAADLRARQAHDRG